jgi:hypothetical protein
MADITYAQLKADIGQKLGLVADSEELQSGDEAIIARKCLSVQAQVSALNITSLYVEGGIDEAYADAFGDLVAAECTDAFDIPEPKRSLIGRNRLGLPGRSPAEIRFRGLFISTKQQTRTDVTVV